jgi:hypothetical protein
VLDAEPTSVVCGPGRIGVVLGECMGCGGPFTVTLAIVGQASEIRLCGPCAWAVAARRRPVAAVV